jgi:hypothetical protein
MFRVGTILKLFLICTFLLLLSLTAWAQIPSFLVAPTYSAGAAQVTADFNHDGSADLAVNNGNITILLGNGDGTFRTGTTIVLDLAVVATADFNGDGTPDLLAINSNGQSPTILSVLLGKGDGTFQSPITTNTGTTLTAITVGDVNGDGKPDVVAFGSGGLSVYLGKGDGTFTALQPNSSIPGNLIVLGDFNGDGKLDLVSVEVEVGSTGGIYVSLGNGDGTFQKSIEGSNVFAAALAVGDFNGDGKLDLAVAEHPGNGYPYGTTLEVLLGNGDGTFRPTGQQIAALAGLLAVGDFNGDGKLDVVADDDGFEQIFLGNGDGTLAAGSTYVATGVGGSNQIGKDSTTAVLVTDFTNDGKLDIAAGSSLTGILIGNGDGTFKGPTAIGTIYGETPSPATQLVAADFNGDGKPDVAFAGDNLYILLNQGAGLKSVTHGYPFPGVETSFAAADLNGDGKLDLIVGLENVCGTFCRTFSIGSFLGNGDGTFGSFVGFQVTGPPIIAVGDFNGDKKPDVAFLSTGNSLMVSLGNGDGTFGSPTSYFAGDGTNWLTVADFNHDGKLDVVVADNAGLAILQGNGDGTFQAPSFISSSSYSFVTVGDVNGDGKPDLIANVSPGGGGQTPPLQVFLGNGDGTFKALAPFGSAGSIVVADINGDNKADLVVGDGKGLAVYPGNGDGTFGGAVRFLAQEVNSPVVADFNLDHMPDVVGIANTDFSDYLVTFINTTPPPAPSFQTSATALLPSTVTAGNTASSTVTVTPINGFSGIVNLSCSISPTVTPAPSCTLPTSVQIAGGKAEQAQLMVATVAPVTVGAVSGPSFPPGAAPYTWMAVLLASAILFVRRRRLALAAPLTILVFFSFVGCGGGGGSSSHITPGTPAGTYTVTVTAKAGGVSSNTSLNVVVQ